LTKLVWSGSLEETNGFTNTFDLDQQILIHNLGKAELHNAPQVFDTIDYSVSPPVQIQDIVEPIANQINNTSEPCF